MNLRLKLRLRESVSSKDNLSLQYAAMCVNHFMYSLLTHNNLSAKMLETPAFEHANIDKQYLKCFVNMISECLSEHQKSLYLSWWAKSLYIARTCSVSSGQACQIIFLTNVIFYLVSTLLCSPCRLDF